MKVEDMFGETFHVFAIKECKNGHTCLGMPNKKKEKCPTCGKKLK
jgi:hypothetical protein